MGHKACFDGSLRNFGHSILPYGKFFSIMHKIEILQFIDILFQASV